MLNLRALRKEGAGSVCLGIGPMKALGQIEGYAAIVEWLFRKFYRLAAAKLMPQHGEKVFWEKIPGNAKKALIPAFPIASHQTVRTLPFVTGL